MKPRVKFCWECGRKLWGKNFIELVVGGHPRILHKRCAQNIQNGARDEEDTNVYESFDIYNRTSDYSRHSNNSFCRRNDISKNDD
jgi:hypothetical protein